ncbi:hypothetical protein E1B28_000627 [Marasmius oreades]|uniref:BSD domain-containing protein n=1 Tax=Marasmius oreades TaxID=181124 RepID=A0A9P8AEK6_9AGAR|nr:uncharacterized protein E1B28_000627 [Marasmius oreades]KAG7098714.1 hypothetical protein E1B28_000627 [Marasmius oreades]
MNFLDPYDITVPATNTPPPESSSQQSLNEEVSQVITSLNRFWGGFRQQVRPRYPFSDCISSSQWLQSQAVLETARKDFSGVVTQAQKELTKLTGETSNEPAVNRSQTDDAEPRASIETLKPSSSSASTTSSSAEESTASTNGSITASNLFSRLQVALPPNVVTTVQNNIPQSLKNTDFSQLRINLTNEFQRLQGVTRSQAEEYVQKSEVLLREAMKEAGDVLRDAVKVIPPEPGSSNASVPVMTWDGTDMWMLHSDGTEATTSSEKGKEKATSNSVATRAEALLKLLKHDPEILKHNPEADQSIGTLYLKWVGESVDKVEDGMESEEWQRKIKAELDHGDDAQALQATLNALVPSEISEDVFWKRYFYRIHQIRQEEEKRKVLIQGTINDDEDFSWEDEEGEEESVTQKDTTPTSPRSRGATLTPQTKDPATSVASEGATSPQASTPANTSPRHSSEESYDLVSSGNVSASGERKKDCQAKMDSDDGDSDWE